MSISYPVRTWRQRENSSPPFQHAHLTVAPADVVRRFAPVLIVEHDALRERVIGDKAEILAVFIRDDERVELPVVLEDARAVDADYLMPAVNDGVGADLVRAVQLHGVMPHDDPFFKAAPQRHKMVTAQQVLHGVLAQGLVRVDRRMGEDKVLRLYRVRKRREKRHSGSNARAISLLQAVKLPVSKRSSPAALSISQSIPRFLCIM